MYELPDLTSCTVKDGTIFKSKVLFYQDKEEPIYVDLKNCSRDPYTVFVSNQDLNVTGKHCFGKSLK